MNEHQHMQNRCKSSLTTCDQTVFLKRNSTLTPWNLVHTRIELGQTCLKFTFQGSWPESEVLGHQTQALTFRHLREVFHNVS